MSSHVTIVGNLTKQPELRFTAGGKAVASFGLAVSRRYQVNNEWQEQTSFFNVTAWGQTAENCCATLDKGSRAIVTGRLEQREYEGKDGKRSIVEIVADEIGPSLKWATCQIERTERTSGSDDTGAYRGSQQQRPTAPVYDEAEAPF